MISMLCQYACLIANFNTATMIGDGKRYRYEQITGFAQKTDHPGAQRAPRNEQQHAPPPTPSHHSFVCCKMVNETNHTSTNTSTAALRNQIAGNKVSRSAGQHKISSPAFRSSNRDARQQRGKPARVLAYINKPQKHPGNDLLIPDDVPRALQ